MCTYVCLYVSANEPKCTYVGIYMYVCMCVCVMYVYVRIYICIRNVYVHRGEGHVCNSYKGKRFRTITSSDKGG